MPPVMQRHPHTVIAAVRRELEAWRRAQSWSRETLAQQVVEAHEVLDGPEVTGLRFDPPTRDAYERMRVNADRLYRWLDDETKDKNLLPANLLPSLIHALPRDRQRHVVDEVLRPLGLASRETGHEHQGEGLSGAFRHLIKEAAEAEVAVSALLDGIAPGELEAAQREIVEAQAVLQGLLEAVESLLLGAKS